MLGVGGGGVDLLSFTIRKQTGVNTEDTKERKKEMDA